MLVSQEKIKNDGIKGIPFSVAEKAIPNRASWRVFKPIIDYNKCTKCQICWLYCPDTAISINKQGFPVVNPKMCKGCGVCAANCPVKAIIMERDTHNNSLKK